MYYWSSSNLIFAWQKADEPAGPHSSFFSQCRLIWIQSSILRLFHRFTAPLPTHLDCGTADMLHAREDDVASCYPALWRWAVWTLCTLASLSCLDMKIKAKSRVMEVVALQSCILLTFSCQYWLDSGWDCAHMTMTVTGLSRKGQGSGVYIWQSCNRSNQ